MTPMQLSPVRGRVRFLPVWIPISVDDVLMVISAGVWIFFFIAAVR